MDGKTLKNAVLDLCDDRNEAAELYNRRRIFECLDQACAIFCRAVRNYKSSITLTTVEGQQDYPLPPDFIDLYMLRGGGYFVRYYDGTDYSWPKVCEWEEIFQANLTDEQAVPSRVAIRDRESEATAITGTATSAGAKGDDGLCTLTDSTKFFLTTGRVWPRDAIHNATDRSSGVVVSVPSGTTLRVALFEGGNDDFTNGDAYTIIPAAEKQLSLEAEAETAGHLIHVPYIAMPAPVYSDFGSWRLPDRSCRGIAAGAAALLQLSRHSYQETAWMNGQFSEEIRRVKVEIGRQILTGGGNRSRQGWV
jgi:hypothetical protein